MNSKNYTFQEVVSMFKCTAHQLQDFPMDTALMVDPQPKRGDTALLMEIRDSKGPVCTFLNTPVKKSYRESKPDFDILDETRFKARFKQWLENVGKDD